MTDKLSLDEMLKLGKKVGKWKLGYDGDRCYEGNYQEIYFKTSEKHSGCLTDHFSYKIYAETENVALGQYWDPAYDAESGNPAVQKFYEFVKLKHEKDTRKRAFELLGITDKLSVKGLIEIAKNADWWHGWPDVGFDGWCKDVHFKIEPRPKLYSLTAELEQIELVKYTGNDAASKEFYKYVTAENKRLSTIGKLRRPRKEKAVFERVRRMLK